MNKHKFLIAISGAVLILILWIWYASSNPVSEQAMVEFLSVGELVENNHSDRVRLGGLVADGTIKLDAENYFTCSFSLKEGEQILPVRYSGMRPDLFKEGAEVIVEGKYLNGCFEADILQTKCASRYEGDLRDADSYNLKELDT